MSVFKSYGQTEKVSLTLQVKDTITRIPNGKEDWFSVVFVCTIKNNSNDTIYFVNPAAYKIFPHPWTISINGREANFWPGDTRCAPSFAPRDIIKLAPQDSIGKRFDWDIFVANFSKKTGTYIARVKYNYLGNQSRTMGADGSILTDLISNYSNTVTFKIVD
jgi:hypothetical protein